jgi:prepilin-type N-terminal cleavage/methylation domain-containing protein
MKKNNNSESGFTLVEIMCSMVIVLPMVILIMNLVPTMASLLQKTQGVTIGSYLSSSYTENLSRLIKEDSGSMSTNYSQSAVALSSPYDGYARSVSDSFDINIKTIQVSVWRDLNSDLVYDLEEPGFTTITNVLYY